jgi:hypothetical protein
VEIADRSEFSAAVTRALETSADEGRITERLKITETIPGTNGERKSSAAWQQDFRVLAVGLDLQASLTVALGFKRDELPWTIANALGAEVLFLSDAIRQSVSLKSDSRRHGASRVIPEAQGLPCAFCF